MTRDYELPWEIETCVTCVVCPGCAFTMDACHTDPDGTYSCPICECHGRLDISSES